MITEKTLEKKQSKNENGYFKSVIKGSLMALSISLILICIFAFILRFCDISSDVIKPINQVIKIVSILIGSFYGLKKATEMGLITGFSIGIFLYNFGFCRVFIAKWRVRVRKNAYK